MKCFMREKIVRCGSEFIFPEIFRYSENQQNAVRRKRAKKQKETAPKQKNLNDERAKRYFIALVNGNFGKGGIAVHLSFAKEYLPPTPEAAMAIAQNYLRRVAYERKKRKLPELKYALVMQLGRKEDGTHRIHFHIFMNGGLDRDFVENLWWVYKGTKQNNYEDRILYGFANADRLRPNKMGLAQLAGYFTKGYVGKKHWTQSQNLEIPYTKGKNDSKYTPRQIQRVCGIPIDAEDYRKFWEKKYPGYEYIDGWRKYTDEAGWAVYMMLRKMKC